MTQPPRQGEVAPALQMDTAHFKYNSAVFSDSEYRKAGYWNSAKRLLSVGGVTTNLKSKENIKCDRITIKRDFHRENHDFLR